MRPVIFIALLTALWVLLGSTLQWVAALAGLALATALFLYLRRDLPAATVARRGRGWRHPLDAGLGVARYAWAVVRSNLRVAWLTVNFRRPVRSAIVKAPVGEMGELERTVLANSITLTPGTITVDFTDDGQFVYVHVLDAEDAESARQELNGFLDAHFRRGLRWMD